MSRRFRWLMVVACVAVSTTACGWHSYWPPYEGSGSPPPHSVSRAFDEALSPHGDWVYVSPAGWVWRPYDHLVGSDFYPYGTHGRWVSTNYGWMFLSDFEWGWATFHYGRWYHDPYYGWVWVPGYRWAPAWVSWRWGGGFVGWVPLGPSFVVAQYYPPYWCYVHARHFGYPDSYRHRVHSPWDRRRIHRATRPTPESPAPTLIAHAGGEPVHPVRVLPPAPDQPGPVRVGPEERWAENESNGPDLRGRILGDAERSEDLWEPRSERGDDLEETRRGADVSRGDGLWRPRDEARSDDQSALETPEQIRRGPSEEWAEPPAADDDDAASFRERERSPRGDDPDPVWRTREQPPPRAEPLPPPPESRSVATPPSPRSEPSSDPPPARGRGESSPSGTGGGGDFKPASPPRADPPARVDRPERPASKGRGDSGFRPSGRREP